MARGMNVAATREALAQGAVLIDTTPPGDCSTRYGKMDVEIPGNGRQSVSPSAIKALLDRNEIKRDGRRELWPGHFADTYTAA